MTKATVEMRYYSGKNEGGRRRTPCKQTRNVSHAHRQSNSNQIPFQSASVRSVASTHLHAQTVLFKAEEHERSTADVVKL